MTFELPKFTPPDFGHEFFIKSPNCKIEKVIKKGVAHSGYHALSIYPEYFKIEGNWVLASGSRMDSVAIVTPSGGIDIVEFRNLKIGDNVVVGRSEDGSEGIYMYTNGFITQKGEVDTFAFRTGRSRETAFSRDYDELYKIMQYEKDHAGKIVWVLGPSIALDYESRAAFTSIVENGYAQAVLSGNNFATYDLEKAMFKTVSGQETFESRETAHYNYIATINEARRIGSLKGLINSGLVKDGILKACQENDVPVVLASSIRDRYTLPNVYDNVYESQDAMRKHTRNATMLICLSSVLHTIAAGNMTPSYTVKDGVVRPVYIYSIDIQEFSVNKLSDRGTLEVKTLVTNVQDFITNVAEGLIK
ncbi:ornithine cyclodeaminase family domain [Clostridium estertheticum]|uniref:ornithine cyclodeaminase family domain n=1 Tax=Clostridium estertheticum TaxID=238834 RepID=UPI001C7D5051|nr:hypothetical protein [Clostridium estertheticum]MBX4263210.1 hypothetical protein [Clostridium estertheticum]MBX4269876.1 hypothetical protein [Clostridium estertheticum]WLC78489.1 hypothetical protein KTC98_14855 [Clostridium estertheticum]WLC89513.1 hypothetical protein KTC95_04670 [Clostridium estertheticum]